MKEKTKKILKGLGLTLGAISLLAVGVGVGACSVKYGSTQPVTTTPIRKGLRQNPKKSPEYKQGVNLLDEAYLQENCYAYPTYAEGGASFANYEVKALELGAGYYYFGNASDGDYVTGLEFDKTLEQVKVVLSDYAMAGRATYPPDWSVTSIIGGTGSSYFYSDGGVYTFSYPVAAQPVLYLVNTLDVPSVNSYYLPKEWFPSSTLTGSEAYPFVSGSTDSGLRIVSLTGVVFRSNGVVYNEIEFSWQNARAMAYGEDRTTITADNLWYLSLVRYVQPNGRGDIVYQPKWGVKADGNTYFSGSYVWVSDVYRSIEVVDYGSISTIDGTTMENKQWFNILANGNRNGVNNPQVTDAFGLLTGALGAVFPLLAIQVLPNITLGLLLMLPLIGAIVVLIIKAVKK